MTWTRLSTYGGVIPIAIYTPPFPCGGECIFCPSAAGMPKSYLPNEDTLWAKTVSYSGSFQIQRFLKRLPVKDKGTGIPVELILLGGSFLSLSPECRRTFLAEVYDEMSAYQRPKNIDRDWETGGLRPSVVCVESRPEQITLEECRFLRSLGVSKVEIGVQHTKDSVLEAVGRKHSATVVRASTEMLKDEGFKVGYHIMLGLPTARIEDDLEMVSSQIWSDGFLPDYLKVYPCVLLRREFGQTILHELYDSGRWRPRSKDELRGILRELGRHVPSTVRISRIQRQFARKHVVSGLLTDGRSLHNPDCRCIRCREAGKAGPDTDFSLVPEPRVAVTQAGRDVFFRVLGGQGTLLAIARSRKVESGSVLREIRVFGRATAIGQTGPIQGKGLGSWLMQYVEKYAKEGGASWLKVNAAYGARGFFRRLGYSDSLADFLVRNLRNTEEDEDEKAARLAQCLRVAERSTPVTCGT